VKCCAQASQQKYRPSRFADVWATVKTTPLTGQ
jgi:hypothetical protein